MSGQSSIQHCPTIHFLALLDIEPRHCHGWIQACDLETKQRNGLCTPEFIQYQSWILLHAPALALALAPEQVLWGFEFLQCETSWPRLNMHRVYSAAFRRMAWKGGRSWRVLALGPTDRKGRLGEKSRGPGRVTRGFSQRQWDEVEADCSEHGGGSAKLTGGGCATKASIPSHSSPVPLASKSHKKNTTFIV